MRTIKIDCPYCSMDHPVSLVPGWQEQFCYNGSSNFIVSIDDYGRVSVYRREQIGQALSGYEAFANGLRDVLLDARWEFMGGHAKPFAFVAKLDQMTQTNMLTVADGNRCQNLREVRRLLEGFYDFVEKNSNPADLVRTWFGHLLLVFDNVYQTQTDDESRALAESSFWKRIYLTVGVFDLCTGQYFGSRTRSHWDSLLPDLMQQAAS